MVVLGCAVPAVHLETVVHAGTQNRIRSVLHDQFHPKVPHASTASSPAGILHRGISQSRDNLTGSSPEKTSSTVQPLWTAVPRNTDQRIPLLQWSVWTQPRRLRDVVSVLLSHRLHTVVERKGGGSQKMDVL